MWFALYVVFNARPMAREMVVPLFGFDAELTLAGFCAAVILGAAVVFRLAPKGFEPSGFFHAVKSGKERPGPDFECALCDQLDVPGNTKAVKFAVADGLEDEQVQRALQKICLFRSTRRTPIERR